MYPFHCHLYIFSPASLFSTSTSLVRPWRRRSVCCLVKLEGSVKKEEHSNSMSGYYLLDIFLIDPSEIGDLLLQRAKYGPGGEYEPDWRPPGPPPPPPETMGPGGPGDGPGGPDEPPPGGIPPPKPAWRRVYTKPSKKKKKDAGPATSAPLPTVPLHPQHMMPFMHEYGDMRQQHGRSWEAWQRSSHYFCNIMIF
jgi:hypothetical protein